MKRILVFILILVLSLLPISTNAANEVFVGINNAMLPLHDAMPIQSGGVWYMDYLDFTRGDLGINASYNADLGTVVFYNWDITLVFNVAQGTATRDGTEFKQWSFAKNGTIYVPAAFVAEQFGFSYSYIREISTIRLRSTSNMSDNMFIYIAKSRIPELLSAYNASTPKDETSTPSTPSNPNTSIIPSPNTNESSETVSDETIDVEDTQSQVAYITIDIKNSGTLTEILNLLSDYNLSATLFVGKNALLGEDNTLRRVYASRHSLGVYADSLDEANQINDTLYAMAKTKSRLLRTDQTIANAADGGYRLWGTNIDVRVRTAAQSIRLLDTRDSSTVLRFDDSETSLSRMKRVFSYINEKNFITRTLDVTTTPVTP